MTRYRSHTPLLIVLLIVSILVAAAAVLADHIDVAMSAVQPVVTAALVAAVGGTRIFIR